MSATSRSREGCALRSPTSTSSRAATTWRRCSRFSCVWRHATEPRRQEREGMHLGLIVPNYGEGVSRDVLRRYAEAAEEHGFDSIWASEHIVVTTDDIYGHFYDPF